MTTDILGAFANYPNRRRLLVTLGALALFRLGCQIPLAGLAAQALQRLQGASGLASERVSIFGLGVTPILSVLFLVQIAELTVPALRRWTRAEPSRAEWLRRCIFVAALALAATQALEIASALEHVPGLVDEPGWAFRTGIVATLVGATAFLGWLGGKITLQGLGNGFWLLLVAPFASAFPSMANGVYQLSRQGAVSPAPLVIAFGFIAFAIALAVAVGQANSRSLASYRDLAEPRRAAGRIPATAMTSQGLRPSPDNFAIVWPPLLAQYLPGLLAAIMSIAALPLAPGNSLRALIATVVKALGGPLHLLLVAVLIAAFTYLRLRSDLEIRRNEEMSNASRPSANALSRLAWITALAQIVICVGAELLSRNLALPFAVNGAWLIVGCAVVTDIAASLGLRPQPRLEPAAPIAR